MNRFESIENLERLRMALTIVIDNDIIIPNVEQREAVFINDFIHGYIWRYKNCGVKVDLNSIMSADILEQNSLYKSVEDIRAYVKQELCKMLNKEANK